MYIHTCRVCMRDKTQKIEAWTVKKMIIIYMVSGALA